MEERRLPPISTPTLSEQNWYMADCTRARTSATQRSPSKESPSASGLRTIRALRRTSSRWLSSSGWRWRLAQRGRDQISLLVMKLKGGLLGLEGKGTNQFSGKGASLGRRVPLGSCTAEPFELWQASSNRLRGAQQARSSATLSSYPRVSSMSAAWRVQSKAQMNSRRSLSPQAAESANTLPFHAICSRLSPSALAGVTDLEAFVVQHLRV